MIAEVGFGAPACAASHRGDLYLGGDFRRVNGEFFTNGARFRECAASTITGDANCDGVVTIGDISAFVLALTNPEAYYNDYADCDVPLADANQDGFVTVADIGPFVALLTR